MIGVARDEPRDDEGADHTGRGRLVGGSHNSGNREIGARGSAPGVESEPAEPQDEHVERGQRDVMAGNRLDNRLPVPVLPVRVSHADRE